MLYNSKTQLRLRNGHQKDNHIKSLENMMWPYLEKRIFVDVINLEVVRWNHSSLYRWALYRMISNLIKEIQWTNSIESAQARRREGNAKTAEKDVATYRGALAATGSQKRRIPPLWCSLRSQKVWPGLHLNFELLASKTGEEQITIVLSQQVYGNLLQQPWKTN